MQKPVFRRRKGFTLIELLVVMAIIVILAAVGFQVGNVAIQRARKVAALAACTELEQGINRFAEEYGTLPIDVTADTTFDSNSAQGMELLKVLLDKEDPAGTVRNSRGIKFINMKQGKGNRGGLMYSADGATLLGLYDPWGGAYQIHLDGDFNEEISVKPKAAASSRTLNGRVCTVWSDGADGVTGIGKVTDDVTTW